MTSHNLMDNGADDITVFYTSNVRKMLQIGIWDDTDVKYHFMPATLQGFVVVTPQGKPVFSHPRIAWVIYRPCVLALKWAATRNVRQLEVPLATGQEWFRRYGRKHKAIKLQRGVARITR